MATPMCPLHKDTLAGDLVSPFAAAARPSFVLWQRSQVLPLVDPFFCHYTDHPSGLPLYPYAV